MMGKLATPEWLFYDFCLDDHVPADHLLRRIDRFVDVDGVRRELKPYYSPMGRPSVDPELMIRMLIVGYCFAIRSERRLCEEVHLNLAYRWFCRLGLDGKIPDHSTFSLNRNGRFRDSDLLRHVFEMVVRRCMDERLVGGEGFAVDASLIQADANKQRSGSAAILEISQGARKMWQAQRRRFRIFAPLAMAALLLDGSSAMAAAMSNLVSSGDASFNGPHGGQAIAVAVVRADDGKVVAKQSGTVSKTASPSFSFTFTGVLENGKAYDVAYWIDSNFGGGTKGVCDAKNHDHQWRVSLGTVNGDVTHTEKHRPAETMSVCDVFK